MSIVARAALAIALMIGFYLLAIGLAAGLFWVPYAEVMYAQRIHVKMAVLCVVGGGMILWSIFPRVDRFEAPGPRLEADKHPRLFATLDDVARRTGQQMPAEVYLVGDVNAWVANRGGIMGFGSRRVMGIGLPLLQALTVSEMRGVLAHEFGHYHGGDTKLGPWVYKTRAAIGRTLENLASGGQVHGAMALLQIPFDLYGKLFLRVTHAVSRHQEYQADALAARTVGAKPLVSALEKVRSAAGAYNAYWRSEVVPVLGAGRLPPLAAGFGTFVVAPHVADAMARTLTEARQASADPYDTHPPLGERIAALAALPSGESPADDPPAITLLEDVGAMEHALLQSLAPDEKLAPVAWDAVGREVFLPEWKAVHEKRGAPLAAVAVPDLPVALADVHGLAARLFAPEPAPDDADARRRVVQSVTGMKVGLALHAAGWDVEALPGRPVEFVKGDTRVDPHAWVADLLEGRTDAEAWRTRCAEAGIA